jgi:UDP-glucose 4-epimerase
MNILITGAFGFLGSFLVKKIAKESSEKVSLYATDVVTGEVCKRVKFIKADICNDRVSLAPFKDLVLDVIVHLVGSPGVWFANENPKEDLQRNVGSLLSVFDIARLCKTEKIVFASSCQVIDLSSKESSEVVAPQNNYGISKYAAENYLRNFAVGSGLNYSILRMSWLYGPGMKKNPIYDIIQSRDGGIIKCFINAESALDFIYIDDAVEAFSQAAMSDAWNNKTVNISSAQPVKINSLISMMEDIMCKVYVPEQPGSSRIISCSFDNSVAGKLGWKPQISINEGFKTTLKSFMEGTKC